MTLEDSNNEPITDPASQAKAFADRFRKMHRLDMGKPIHGTAQPMPPLQIETAVVQHALVAVTPTKDRVSIHSIRQFSR